MSGLKLLPLQVARTLQRAEQSMDAIQVAIQTLRVAVLSGDREKFADALVTYYDAVSAIRAVDELLDMNLFDRVNDPTKWRSLGYSDR